MSGGVLPDLRYSKLLASDQWFGSIVIDGALESARDDFVLEGTDADDAEAIRSYVIFRANQSLAESNAAKN